MLHAIRFSAAVCLLAAGMAAQGIPKQEAKLVAPATDPPGAFGYTSALSGDYAVIGNSQGAADVFMRSGTVWTEQGALIPSGASAGSFGQMVALSGDTAVVGAPGTTNPSWPGPGAAFVFVRQGAAWTQQAVLHSDESNGQFGGAVAVSGDTIVVGDWLGGRAYIFERTGLAWAQTAKFTGQSYFGDSVAVSGDTVLVGMQGLFGNGVVVYVRSGGTWTLQTTLSPNPGSYAQFGERVVIDGDTAAVRVWDYLISDRVVYIFVRSGAVWTIQSILKSPVDNGDFAESLALSELEGTLVAGVANAYVGTHSTAGLAYVFVRQGTTWVHQATMTASDPSDGDAFGISAGLSGDTAVVGAWQADTAGPGDGAVYVFHPVQPWSKLEGGLAGAAGLPVLDGTGTLDAGSTGTLTLSNAAPFTLTMLFVSLANTPTPFKGGVLSTVPIAFQLPVGTFFTGSWTLPWSAWPAGVPSDSELYFQVGVSDAAAVKGVAISNLLKATQP